MSSTESTDAVGQEMVPAKKVLTSEVIFKYVNLFVLLILLFCIKGFLNYREFCQENGIYVFSVDSFIWSLFGFIFIFVRLRLTRSSSTRGTTWCETEWRNGCIPSTRASSGCESYIRCLSSRTIASFTSLWPSSPTLCSATSIGSPAWSEGAEPALRSTRISRTGLITPATNCRLTLWSSWEFTFFLCSKWW